MRAILKNADKLKETFEFNEPDVQLIYSILPGRGASLQISQPFGTGVAPLEAAAETLVDKKITVELYNGDKLLRTFDGRVERYIVEDQKTAEELKERIFIGKYV